MGKEIQNTSEIQKALEQLQGLARVKASAKKENGSTKITIKIVAQVEIEVFDG